MRVSLNDRAIQALISSMKKVLVVEDDPSMRWLLKTLLRSKYNVVTKSNGMEAFSWLSAQNIPDLIICDIRMPVMDGHEFLENLAISGLYKNCPIIMLTGFNDPKTRKRCLDQGAYDCLVKPFKPSEFLDKIAHPFVSKMFL
jgi:two-component system chemotaxis response regulator CheY